MLLHTSGVADYDFSTPAFNQFDPALSLEEMNAGAEIVDHFATHDDVVAWAAANPNFAKGGTLSRLDLLVTVLAMQKGLIASSKDLSFTVGKPPGFKSSSASKMYDLISLKVEGSPWPRQDGGADDRGGGGADDRGGGGGGADNRGGGGGGGEDEKAKKPSLLPLALGAAALFLLGRK